MSEPAQRPSLMRLAPLGLFLMLAGMLLGRLFAGDASHLPSPLIGHQTPPFELPAIDGYPDSKGLKDADLRGGHVSILNVFASWCPPCRAEHRTLMALSRDENLKAKGVRLYGLSYKDEPKNARKFLEDDGNPFAAIGADYLGMTSINLGVYGVPETYIVAGDGVITYKYVGPLSQKDFTTTLLPEIEKAMAHQEQSAAAKP